MRIVKLRTATVSEIVIRNNRQRLLSILEKKNDAPIEFQRVESYPRTIEIKGTPPKEIDVKNEIFEKPFAEIEKEYNI